MNDKLFHYMKRVVDGQFVMPCCIELHPSNRCNQDCVWCIMREHRKNNGMLSKEQLQNIAVQMGEASDIRYIFISGGGEPLTHPDLFSIYNINGKSYSNYFELLFKSGISIGLSTNGELLTKIIECEAYQYIDAVRISVDAGTEEQYKKLHRTYSGFTLSKLVHNIERYKKASGKKVEISYLMNEENRYSYYELAKIFNDKEAVSFIKVKPLIGEKLVLEQGIEDEVYEGINIIFDKPKKTTTYNYSAAVNLLINAEGNVYSCCHVIDEGEEYLLGSINKKSIEDIIHENQDFINNTDCKRCMSLEINYLLNQFKELDRV